MEIKINREIRQYTESVFMGLNMRQLICSIASAASAAAAFFLLRGRIVTEALSWSCIMAAAPFAALGFISYHGMTAEKLLWAWLRSEVIEPRRLPSAGDSYYQKLLSSEERRRRSSC